jgi:hypothetical protein
VYVTLLEVIGRAFSIGYGQQRSQARDLKPKKGSFTMNQPQFQSSLGGHAPGHLRDLPIQALEDSNTHNWWEAIPIEDVFDHEEQQAWWECLRALDRAKWLTGQLWNCTDILPGGIYDMLDMSGHMGTFGAAARLLRKELN